MANLSNNSFYRNGIPNKAPKKHEMDYTDLVPRDARYAYVNYEKKKLILPLRISSAPPLYKNRAALDYSTRRQVLPCTDTLIHKVIRREPLPSAGGLVNPQGYARHQEKGLAYLPEYPINKKVMKTADFYNPARNNKLPNLKG